MASVLSNIANAVTGSNDKTEASPVADASGGSGGSSPKLIPRKSVPNGVNGHADVSDSSQNFTGGFTPVQAHYIIKSLVTIEVSREWTNLSYFGGLTKFDLPFSKDASHTVSKNTKGGAPPSFKPEQIPDPALFRGMFRSHVLTFPGFSAAPRKFWQDRGQPWIDGIAAHGLSTVAERGEPTKRLQLNLLLARLIGAWFARGVRVGTDSNGKTLDTSTAARPGPREIEAMNNVFPGAGTSAAGWYIGVVASGRSENDFTIGSQEKGERVVFSAQSLADVQTLAKDVKENDADDLAPYLAASPYPGMSLPVHVQTYLRTLANVYPNLQSGAQQRIDSFFAGGATEVSSDEANKALAGFKEQDAKLVPLHRAWLAAGKRVDELTDAWRSWTNFLTVDPQGLNETWKLLKNEHYTDLPDRERLCVEKAGIYVAYFLWDLFVTGPSARESVAGLRWIIALTPWWPLRQLLRIADPSKLIAALLAFILARPFGTKSLFQRLAGAIFGSQASSCRRDAKSSEKKIFEEVGATEGSRLVEGVRQYVNSSSVDERIAMNKRAAAENKALIQIIEGDNVPQSVIPELQHLIAKLSMARDYESLIEFSGSATFVKVIKDAISVVLYGPLTKWAKKCRLYDRVHDLQLFFDDLIATAKSKDNDLNAFLKLTAKHQQKLYYLFHEAETRGNGMIDSFKRWCQIGLDWMRTSNLDVENPSGAPTLTVDLEELVSKSGVDRAAIVKEADSIAEFTIWSKLRWDIEMRRNVLLQENARGLADRVDIEKAIEYAAASLGKRTPPKAAPLNPQAKGALTETKVALGDHYAWTWMADPGVATVLEQDRTPLTRAGPPAPRVPKLRKLTDTFLEVVKPTLQKADAHTLERVKKSKACH